MEPSLHYQAAKLAMGTLHADAIKATIHALVDEGVFLVEILDAMDARRPRIDEVEPALLAAFKHYGIVVPNKELAVWQLLEFHLLRITDGTDDPLDGLRRMMADVYWDYDFHTPTKKWLGDSHGIEQLVGIFWGADDLRERPEDMSWNGKQGEAAWSELKRQIVVDAEKWLTARRDNQLTSKHSLP